MGALFNPYGRSRNCESAVPWLLQHPSSSQMHANTHFLATLSRSHPAVLVATWWRILSRTTDSTFTSSHIFPSQSSEKWRFAFFSVFALNQIESVWQELIQWHDKVTNKPSSLVTHIHWGGEWGEKERRIQRHNAAASSRPGSLFGTNQQIDKRRKEINVWHGKTTMTYEHQRNRSSENCNSNVTLNWILQHEKGSAAYFHPCFPTSGNLQVIMWHKSCMNNGSPLWRVKRSNCLKTEMTRQNSNFVGESERRECLSKPGQEWKSADGNVERKKMLRRFIEAETKRYFNEHNWKWDAMNSQSKVKSQVTKMCFLSLVRLTLCWLRRSNIVKG